MRLRNIPGAKEAIENSRFVVHQVQEKKGRWNQVFGNNNPIHIEVGMGKGRFLMEMAALNPEINYIGIEMYDSVLLRAVQKMEEKQAEGTVPENLRFIRMDARELPLVFDKNEVDRIYLNFSDPWPKERHAKRRLTSRQFLIGMTRSWRPEEWWNLKQTTGPFLSFLWKRQKRQAGNLWPIPLTFIMILL